MTPSFHNKVGLTGSLKSHLNEFPFLPLKIHIIRKLYDGEMTLPWNKCWKNEPFAACYAVLEIQVWFNLKYKDQDIWICVAKKSPILKQFGPDYLSEGKNSIDWHLNKQILYRPTKNCFITIAFKNRWVTACI